VCVTGTEIEVGELRCVSPEPTGTMQAMSAFEKIRAAFDANWTTVLVAWTGLGPLSPWPDRWVEFPPLISTDDIAAYADERLASSDPVEQVLIVALVSSDLRSESRETIKELLTPLSGLGGGDPDIELRKWRLVLLEEVLVNMPKDALHGLMALTEFWQSFGFPSDSPHDVQGRGNTTSPSEYYQQDNLHRLVARHRAWIEDEKAALKKQRVG